VRVADRRVKGKCGGIFSPEWQEEKGRVKERDAPPVLKGSLSQRTGGKGALPAGSSCEGSSSSDGTARGGNSSNNELEETSARHYVVQAAMGDVAPAHPGYKKDVV
jgi:hypothetical protein